MFITTVLIALMVNVVLSNNDGGKPHAELPCLVIGGNCAKKDGCPAGSGFITQGLCPEQQDAGIECCKPGERQKRSQIKCRSRGGSCESKEEIQCPSSLTVREATDCGNDEVCCVFVK